MRQIPTSLKVLAVFSLLAEATAAEVRVTGMEWTFAPTVTVPQDVRWGRSYEGYSEDPAIVASYTGVFVRGLQGEPGSRDFLRPPHVLATTKHYLADGGTEGAQQYNIEAFGSANSQKSFSIDGLKVNWAGGDGGATMMYYGFEMYDEYNMQTASGTAESDVSGVFMNMVTKSGGNRFTSDNNFYFMNDALQGSNIDDDLRRRLGLQPGQATGAAGNPIDVSYDWSSTLGGPIRRDKAWFFGAWRLWRLDQFQIGASNPDGSQAIDDNRIRNFMGKATWQTTPTIRTSLLFNKNINDRWPEYEAALKSASVKFEAYFYPETLHGFHNNSTPRYQEKAAKLAWDRTVAHFKKHLA